jgi:chaperonin GroES
LYKKQDVKSGGKKRKYSRGQAVDNPGMVITNMRTREHSAEASAQKNGNNTFLRRIAMALKPLHDRVLVKRLDSEEKTKGGIIIPDSAKEKPLEGKVVAAGDGKLLDDGKRQPLAVKKGDKILFGKYAGTEIKVEGEEMVILREDDILAIVE